MKKPFRLELQTDCIVPLPRMQENAERCSAPRVQMAPPHGRKLAIVGGGPLVAHDLPELQAWHGDVWGINHTAGWLVENGIDAMMVSVDPQPWTPPANVRRALLATCADPSVFEQLAGKDVKAFDLHETALGGIFGGCTTATRMPILALRMGYTDISFFGCEGSYSGDRDHVDRHNGEAMELIIRAGGNDYRCETGLLIQCQDFAAIFGTFGNFFKNRSGGLLKAMIENPDTWEIVAVSAAMRDHLEKVNGEIWKLALDEPYHLKEAA